MPRMNEKFTGSNTMQISSARQSFFEQPDSNDEDMPTSPPPVGPLRKKRTRTLTTPHQSAVLHAVLAQSRFPTTAMREEVGRSIGLSARKVQIWFQNQREKARRPGSQSDTSQPGSLQYETSSSLGSGASNSAFYHLPAVSFSDPSITPVDFNSSIFNHYDSPVSSAPGSTQIPPLDFDFAQLGSEGFDFVVRAPSPEQAFPLFAGHSSLQENHCIYYFEHVRKVQYIFAGNTVTNVTCSMIVQEPRGAVTNAVCALASLHHTRMRVAHGLEAPDPNPEHSTAKYFHDEAYFQVHNAKQARGSYSESDAIASLHLVWFSVLSGGATDWQPVFAVACGWVAQQTDLLTNSNPKLALQNLPTESQLIVKLTLWVDIFSTLTIMRPPKYLALYRRLFGDLTGWHLPGGEIRMDALTGCPDEVLLGIAEVSALSHWKTAEKRKGTLSSRDLIRRGDEIEQCLRKRTSSLVYGGEFDIPLHPTLLQAGSEAFDTALYPTRETRQLVAKIFFEAALLYLHTVLSDSNPGVPEISTSVGVIVQYLGQLPSSEVDRALVFPICLAGCMTDDSTWREFLKGRLQALDESLGNLMRTRVLIEAVWQKRDVSGATVDWRETIRERGLNLLLV
ncbi:fungal-specific transcription factor domain-containing protein [Mycena epipterygia]|nr:fungal-specific transcription factor domain-containing protein [Mycena epipterygia]